MIDEDKKKDQKTKETNPPDAQEERGAHNVRLYELGYHLLPTVAPEGISEEVAKIRDVVEARGGTIVSDEMPKTMQLAYPIPKVLKTKRTFFDSAYFGWMRFHAEAEAVKKIATAVEENEAILRCIVVRTEPEKAAKPPKKMKFLTPSLDKIRDRKVREKPKTPKPKEKLSEEELEKTIEELIVE